ncbi:nuclear transport factor 2 family protein [Rhodococcus sp. BP-332]|uniref:nuclear transport factor 2 family protein n=1 Tax=unclassified Rhodococcus (in: high G+C Gram-positive bacteria) TaxID=192944 RepID=UPI001C9B071A|nr:MULTISPECIES: nuclear transport factor 2 family protein [unclassified Rhodococcus (in: high G+C Gram-positive bacteria)]MBY6678029.1 nuclear transport factor 2 family protein [Rhodococcus sp. BP-332]
MTEPRVLDIDTVKAEILDLEDRRYQAVVDGDFDTFRSLCHPDLVYTHSDGSRDSVASYLEKVESGFYVYHRIDHPTDDVLVSGDTAIVVGEMNASITANGKDKDLVNNCIAVWVRENGSWLLLAYQPTPRPAS